MSPVELFISSVTFIVCMYDLKQDCDVFHQREKWTSEGDVTRLRKNNVTFVSTLRFQFQVPRKKIGMWLAQNLCFSRVQEFFHLFCPPSKWFIPCKTLWAGKKWCVCVWCVCVSHSHQFDVINLSLCLDSWDTYWCLTICICACKTFKWTLQFSD